MDDWRARLAELIGARERRRAADRDLRAEMRQRRAGWLDHRHRRRLRRAANGPAERAGGAPA